MRQQPMDAAAMQLKMQRRIGSPLGVFTFRMVVPLWNAVAGGVC
jgi:hypothetical protein